MSYIKNSGYIDTTGVAHGYINNAGAPQICSQPYLQALAEGDIAGHTPFSKIGYAPSMTANVNTDIWSYCATQPIYLFPTVPMQMEVLSSDNTKDIATVIKSGTATGGSTTTLTDLGVDFTTATAVAIGDTVVLDKAGTTPEYGYVTAVAQHELTIANGFSYGGNASGRTYQVIDDSPHTGAKAVQITYLDTDYAEKHEIVILNGTTVVPTVATNIFRVNNFRVIIAGSDKVPKGNITLRHIDNTPVYSYITAGFTRARNAMYTVPAGKTLYVTDFNSGYATTGNANKEYGRVTTRANIDPTTNFRTGGIFYPFTDTVMQNTSVPIQLSMPTSLLEKTDIKISVVASSSGIVISTLRGWLETN